MALREIVLATKLTAVNPWIYTGKARGWVARLGTLLDDLGRAGDSPASRTAYDTLRSEIERDTDYQEARRRS